jgi:hypothetical protein
MPGNRGAWVFRRDDERTTEFIALSLWDSIDASRAFASQDIEAGVLYPEDERYPFGARRTPRTTRSPTTFPTADRAPAGEANRTTAP